MTSPPPVKLINVVVFPLAKVSVITPVTATVPAYLLGHLGYSNTDRIVSIYVAMPKVAKASTIRVAVAGISAGIITQCSPM